MADQHTPVENSTEPAAVTPKQYQRLQQIHQATVEMTRIDEMDSLMETMVNRMSAIFGCPRALLLLVNPVDDEMTVGAVYPEPDDNDQRKRLQKAYINLTPLHHDPYVESWQQRALHLHNLNDNADSPITELVTLAGMTDQICMAPIYTGEDQPSAILIGEIAENYADADKAIMQQFAESSGVILHTTRLHTDTVGKLADKMREMSMLQQLDRELNERIELPTVFEMALDWALRFTNANTATMALYDEITDSLRTARNYGYTISDDEIEHLRSQYGNTLTHRVARSGRIEVLPDVLLDQDYAWIDRQVRSQMAVPVMREDRVIAVIALESYKINAFTDDHISFVQQLANRAAVAVDNARLYDETVRERERLSYILSTIGDVVIIINTEGKIVLISQSAMSALQLRSDAHFHGKLFTEVIDFKPLVDVYRRAATSAESGDEELHLPNERTYYVRATPKQGIGWIIVMQDITLFKEMDQVKSELIATVSHDLKQPLGVMRGYLDLLQMKNTFDDPSKNFVRMIDNAINNMRQLIDDLLDLARIESGVDLDFEEIPLSELIEDCIASNRPGAIQKHQTLTLEMPDDVPTVAGDLPRLSQVFNNLVGNAIKYTQAGGDIKVNVEPRGVTVRVSIEDNGLGISPEDQPHIFDRFYRVRSPENDDIDGTGLGLAIVKSLIEAHRGKIRLESQLGKGSTFFVTLPAND